MTFSDHHGMNETQGLLHYSNDDAWKDVCKKFLSLDTQAALDLIIRCYKDSL